LKIKYIFAGLVIVMSILLVVSNIYILRNLYTRLIDMVNGYEKAVKAIGTGFFIVVLAIIVLMLVYILAVLSWLLDSKIYISI